MKPIDQCQAILSEMEAVITRVDPEQVDRMVDAILQAPHIFVTGTGRSLLMVRALAMRLMQLGFSTFVVGETVTPAIGSDDLLIIGSGSGETATNQVIGLRAKESGARLALFSIFPDSTLGKMADVIVEIPATTTLSAKPGRAVSIQPGASLFEQCLLILFDSIILQIIKRKNITDFNVLLMQNHANLE
ncbi:MAG: 6-phospho-3-hexuloisomerase [Leptolinea sp.]|nr:6-phospho-3-hexuloisomerase [Leptolinea sp.]